MTCPACGQNPCSNPTRTQCIHCGFNYPSCILHYCSVAQQAQAPQSIAALGLGLFATVAYAGPGLSQIWKDNPEYEEEIANLKSEISHLEEFVAKLLEKPGMTEELLKEMLSEDDRRVLEVLKKDAASV